MEYDVATAQPLCFDESNGSISITQAEGQVFDVLWQDESSDASLTDIVAGWYSFTLTDEYGCDYQDSVFVDQPLPIELTIGWENPSCSGYLDGSIWAEAVGGTGAIEISFPTVENTEAVSGDVYPVMATDENGCVAETNIIVTDPSPLEVDYIVTQPESELSGGQILIIPSGGTPPWINEWNSGEIDLWEDEGLELGTYLITVYDDNGCETVIEFEIDDIYHVSENGQVAWMVYPNPTRHYLTIDGQVEKGSVSIYNIAGQEVMQKQSFKAPFTLDVSALSSGSYQLLISTNSSVVRVPLVKE